MAIRPEAINTSGWTQHGGSSEIYEQKPKLNEAGELQFAKKRVKLQADTVLSSYRLKDSAGAGLVGLVGGTLVPGLPLGLAGSVIGPALGICSGWTGFVSGLAAGSAIAATTLMYDTLLPRSSAHVEWKQVPIIETTHTGFTEDELAPGLIHHRADFERKNVGSYYEPQVVYRPLGSS